MWVIRRVMTHARVRLASKNVVSSSNHASSASQSSITPVISYSYAPSADISSEFLRALNKSKQGYLGAIAQNRVTLSLSHVLEASRRCDEAVAAALKGRVA